MKKFCLLIALHILVAHAQNVEKMDSLQTRDGKEFFDVTITGKDNVGIKISHRSGVSRVAYEMLSDSLQKKFQYDPAKASEQKEKEKQIEALHIQQTEKQKSQIAKATQPDPITTDVDDTSTESYIPIEKIPDDATLTKMEMYISDLKIGISTAEKKIALLHKEAVSDKLKMKTHYAVDIYGNELSRSSEDRAAQSRGERKEREALKLTAQVEQAKILLDSATQKFERMKAQAQSP